MNKQSNLRSKAAVLFDAILDFAKIYEMLNSFHSGGRRMDKICPICGHKLEQYRCEDYCHGLVTVCTNEDCNYEVPCSCMREEEYVNEQIRGR